MTGPVAVVTGFSPNNQNQFLIPEHETRFVIVIQIQSKGLLRHSVGCMDEFSIFIDSDGFNNQNREAFRFFSSSEDKPAFDVILSALSDGTFLTPLLFFSGGPSLVPDGFPENILLEARRAGFTDQERLQIWINKVCIRIRLFLSFCFIGNVCAQTRMLFTTFCRDPEESLLRSTLKLSRKHRERVEQYNTESLLGDVLHIDTLINMDNGEFMVLFKFLSDADKLLV